MTDANTGQLVADLTSTNNAVQGNGWVSPELGGSGGGSLSMLGSTLDPLSGLASVGLGWFTPFVSFLSDGLGQLQGGNAASVTSGSQQFGTAGDNITNLAGSYGNSVTGQTTNWTGQAASDYRNTGAQAATGVAGLGTASSTVGSSIIGAGQVVAQAIADITELIGEAVAQIVPIMTQAVARAQQPPFGESILEAIPPCVGIAVEYAMKIASKLAALLASGQNLLKLVQGALGVVDLIQQALSSISQQSTQPTTGGGTDQSGAGSQPSNANFGNAAGTAPASTTPSSAAGGADSGGSTPSGSADSGGSAGPDAPADLGGSVSPDTSTGLGGPVSPADLTGLDASALPGVDPQSGATESAAMVQPFHGTTPSASPSPVHADAVSTGAGALPSMGLAAGTRAGVGLGADTVRQGRGLSPSATSTEGSEGAPLGGMGGARPTGEKDKEHKRKYSVVEQHDEVFVVAPPVIGSEG